MYEQVENAVKGWMRRVKNMEVRPVPVMVLRGKSGVGKTTVVEKAAKVVGIDLIEVGSDSVEYEKGEVRGALGTKKSYQRWVAVLRARPRTPQALFIDDADGVLSSEGFSIKVADFIKMGRGMTPIIIAATDMYANALLRDLLKHLSKIVMVTMIPPEKEILEEFFARTFPTLAAQSIDIVMAERPGNVKGIMNQLSFLAATNTVSSTAGPVVVTEENPFEAANAALRVGKTLPRTYEDAETVVGKANASLVSSLVRKNYQNVIGKRGTKRTLAAMEYVSDMYATCDTMPASAMDASFVPLRAAWLAVREVQFADDVGSRPADVRYAGPINGNVRDQTAQIRRLGAVLHTVDMRQRAKSGSGDLGAASLPLPAGTGTAVARRVVLANMWRLHAVMNSSSHVLPPLSQLLEISKTNFKNNGDAVAVGEGGLV